jgi:hypothetical protein
MTVPNHFVILLFATLGAASAVIAYDISVMFARRRGEDVDHPITTRWMIVVYSIGVLSIVSLWLLNHRIAFDTFIAILIFAASGLLEIFGLGFLEMFYNLTGRERFKHRKILKTSRWLAWTLVIVGPVMMWIGARYGLADYLTLGLLALLMGIIAHFSVKHGGHGHTDGWW